jgi:hypothetical protein
MLQTQATFLGGFAGLLFYVLDGDAWIVAGQTVLRCEDDEKTRRIVRDLKILETHHEQA